MLRSRIALLALCGGLVMAACQWLVFVYAPEEQVMGLVQKIFYIHLPLAWWGLVSFGAACVSGILYLRRRDMKYDLLAAASVETGMVCCTLTLVTGSLWARHSWGVWWTWDPRLATFLVLWFIYAGCMALRAVPLPEGRRAALCSVIAIAGFLDVPLVFLSARLWRSIHPAVFAARGGGLEPEMAAAVFACTAGFGLVWLALLLLRWKQLCLTRALNIKLDVRMFEQMMDETDGHHKG
ncbi:cytochrome c biogenesis protein CcsA [uncultured Mailhella sp.]|uniref:cytochrome c biogenesis protein n=1 Tax=uncultured Mailhella sp. TaxID=1981031 RepID=UPI00262DED5F|nr:cytochrome c biogenesis protein CcsA [uncultured Mailhella sp.]